MSSTSAPFGTIFVNLLKLIAVPLVFASLVTGIASLASETVSVAFGAEWRQEKYIMFAGSLESYAAGPWAAVGQEINPETGDFYPMGYDGGMWYLRAVYNW